MRQQKSVTAKIPNPTVYGFTCCERDVVMLQYVFALKNSIEYSPHFLIIVGSNTPLQELTQRYSCVMREMRSRIFLKKNTTVFPRLNAAAFIFFTLLQGVASI